jgi:Leucine-rich repeat (LRR) protein
MDKEEEEELNLVIKDSTLTCFKDPLSISLISVSINKTGITDVSNINFMLLVNLEDLNLYDNHISKFTNDIPNKLTHLNLSHNKLKFITRFTE